MVSKLESQVHVSGLERCASITSLGAFLSCAAAVLGDAVDATSLAAFGAADAVVCGAKCLF